MNEKLSALLDDELSEHERAALLRDLGRDAELRSAWDRYHVIRDVMRRDLGALAPGGLADRVRERLAAEADPSIGRWRAGRPLFKVAATLAIAASVAAVAIIAVRPSMTPETAAPVTAALPSAVVMAPAPAPAAMASAQDRALNAMLVKHSEFSPAVGVNGLASYVRVVGHSAERNDAEK